ncbi:MAG: homocysteine S-methyltransferase family protein, partial [Planctomycetes bacterium]|nr:homocysteine S-methyltransferase family protein [Planctomycetota bacterium]
MATAKKTDVRRRIESLLEKRILLLDGGMGTMVQVLALDEAAVRAQRFADHNKTLKNLVDILCLTQPDAVVDIHRQYLEAGADIIQTNTFGSSPIALGDFDLGHLTREINLAAADCARRAVEQTDAAGPHGPRFIAGSIGPTSKTASISPRVEDPGFRAVTFDDLVASYYEQVAALVEGGVDLLFPETTFDTLNLKACLFAIDKFFVENNVRLPVMVSVTITDASGRTLSGQTIEAFWNSISQFDLLSVGVNCSLGPEGMRPYVEELSQIVPVYISCHPNAGLPNEFGGYDQSPEQMTEAMREFVTNGWL